MSATVNNTKRTQILLSFAVFTAAFQAPGQTISSVVNQAIDFCKDPRRDVRAYCKDLNDLQAAANSGATKNTASGTLNKLDLSHPAATPKFITAAADVVTENAVSSAVRSKAAASNALQEAGHARLDRQSAPTGNGSGTTSLVSKAGNPELLSLALDTGALTQSVNGTTSTLNTNADEIFRLVSGTDPDCTVTCRNLGWFETHVLNPTNISASINLAQPSTITAATSGQASGSTPIALESATVPAVAGKLSGVTTRYQLMNRFDPRSADFKKKWNDAITASKVNVAAITLMGSTNSVMKLLTSDAKTFALDRDQMIQKAKSDPTGQALTDFFDSYFSNALQEVLKDQSIPALISQVMQDRALYRQAWFNALDEAAGNLVTFEYNYNHPVNQPVTNTFKLIYAYDFGTTGMVTFNGSVSLYDSLPRGAKYGRLHYGQVSAEYDRTLAGRDKSLQSQLSLAGYWQYQPNPSVLNIPAGTVAPGTTIPVPNGTQEFVGTAGSLWVTQAKLTFKGAGNVSVPIGVSWSNKTDLLQGSKIGAQFGINYNFSSILGLFGGSAAQ